VVTRGTIGARDRASRTIIALLAPAALLIAFSGCPGEEAQGQDTCGPGEGCDCFVALDCPGIGEQCVAGTCVLLPGEDTGEDAPEDTAADFDATPDIPVDVEPDVVADAELDTRDASDSTDGGDLDDTSTDPEVSVDPDVVEDLGGGGDDPDVVDEPDLIIEADAYADITIDAVDPSDTSPDGAALLNPWIAFVNTDGESTWVQLIRSDGRDNQILDLDVDFAEGPAWAPDGRQLVVVTYDNDLPQRTLRLVNFRRSRITTIPTGLTSVGRPQVSPDGTRLVVEGRIGDGPNRIWALDFPAGGDCDSETGCTELTSSGDGDADPQWNADGTLVYFTRSDADEATYDIFRVASDGGSASPVTSTGNVAGSIALSLDGAHLYYPRPVSDTIELVRFTVSGGATSVFGARGDSDLAPFPDGTRVAVIRRSLDSDSELAILDATTGALIQRLTFDDVANSAPAVGSISSGSVDVSF
jgi:sugar lactone lactonase YvrE